MCMEETKFPNGKTAQEIQDEIFRKMPVDKKIALASEFWQFVKDFRGTSAMYVQDRPKKTLSPNRQGA